MKYMKHLKLNKLSSLQRNIFGEIEMSKLKGGSNNAFGGGNDGRVTVGSPDDDSKQ